MPSIKYRLPCLVSFGSKQRCFMKLRREYIAQYTYCWKRICQGPFLSTWTNFNPCMGKKLHHQNMGGIYLSIPKLQRYSRFSLRLDKSFHPTLCWACDFLSIVGLKLIHVSRGIADIGHPCVAGWNGLCWNTPQHNALQPATRRGQFL